MSNLNPSYASTINNVDTTFSDRTALSLPDLKRNIITAYHAMTKFSPRALRAVTNSYSARFPASWKTTAAYHTPGVRLTGQTDAPKRNFRDITLDDRIVTHIFMDELDANARALIQFDEMFAMEMGQAIAQFDDQNAAIVAVLAARASATVSGGDGGTQIEKASADSNVGALNAAIWEAKNKMDEKNVPMGGRSLIMRPAQYNLMAATHDRMFHRELGQGGSIGAAVSLPAYAGFSNLDMSNNIPSTNIGSSPTGAQNTYHGDFTKTVAVGFTQGAFGSVYSSASLPMGGNQEPAPTGADTATQMQPLDVREVAIKEAYGTLYMASLITGKGVLNPPGAVEIKTP